jgi:hypothetical protein
MNVNEILQQLKQQRSRLDAAIQALQGTEGHGKRHGRPPGSKNQASKASAAPKRRAMSAAARKLMAEAMRKRWAAAKKAGKKRL